MGEKKTKTHTLELVSEYYHSKIQVPKTSEGQEKVHWWRRCQLRRSEPLGFLKSMLRKYRVQASIIARERDLGEAIFVTLKLKKIFSND